MIPVFEPYLFGNEKKYINECLDTNWISSQGKFILKFEQSIADYHNCKHCIVTSSCTTAIHLALKSINIKEGDEVICPALTFIAPANMIALSGAKLVLVDIDPKTMTIDPDKIKKSITKKTKAIVVVHQFGHSSHMDEIMEIAREHNLKIIEDNAESLGGKYKGKLLGSIGDISTFSFFANKIMTTGEGGAILTNDDSIADHARILRDHGMSKNERYKHLELGYNYRMTNLQAAIGLAQIEKIDEILLIRNKQMECYYNLLTNKNIILREFADWTTPVHWLMTMAPKDEDKSNDFIDYMLSEGVECRPMINPVHHAEHFSNSFKDKDFSQSESISNKFFHLPSSTGLKEKEIIDISQKVLSYFT